MEYHDTHNIDVLTSWREGKDFSPINLAQLKMQAGSSDIETSKEARRKLMQYFDLSPERSANQAETIDLMEAFGSFPEEIQQKILSGVVGIQLTEGCNGRCAFCMFGKKKGVEAKFSYDSIREFLKTYGSKMRSEDKTGIFQYWDSDPFDYQDGEKRYKDVYQDWRKNLPDRLVTVSTTIPKGSVEDFIDFTDMLFEKFRSHEDDPEHTADEPCKIRVSVGNHNIQRVESVMKEIKQQWISKGFSEDQTQRFLRKHITISPRLDDKLVSLGDQIGDHDDFADVSSPVCEDGVVITPKGFHAVTMTAATIYQPSGEYRMSITPTMDSRLIPKRLNIGYFQGMHFMGHLAGRVELGQVLFPQPIQNGRFLLEIDLQDESENFAFKLGRWCFSLNGMIKDISDLEYARDAIQTPDDIKRKFLELCSHHVRSRTKEISQTISHARELATKESDDPAKDKLEYYAVLTEVYQKKIELITKMIDDNVEMKLIVAVANALKEVTKENVTRLPEVITNLQACVDKSISIYNRTIALDRSVRLLNLDPENIPDWAKKLM
jgi:hypothetical protein